MEKKIKAKDEKMIRTLWFYGYSEKELSILSGVPVARIINLIK